MCPWRHKFQLSHWCNRWNNYDLKTVNRNRAYYYVFFLVSNTLLVRLPPPARWRLKSSGYEGVSPGEHSKVPKDCSAFTFSVKQFTNLSVKINAAEPVQCIRHCDWAANWTIRRQNHYRLLHRHSFLFRGYRGSFLGVKWLGREVYHSPLSTTEVKKDQHLYSHFQSLCTSWGHTRTRTVSWTWNLHSFRFS